LAVIDIIVVPFIWEDVSPRLAEATQERPLFDTRKHACEASAVSPPRIAVVV
jgi:hypothetical protein